MTHRASANPSLAENRTPSSECNDIEVDADGGIWEYIGEDGDYCYYWGPA